MIFDRWPKGMLDQQVTLVGTADNAYVGALVVLSDSTTIYVGGLDEWDEALYGKEVRVTGTLRKRKLAPDPEVNEKGEHSHGMHGRVTVVDDATWEQAS